MNQVASSIEILFQNRVHGLPASYFADVLDRLIWCLSDNGSSVLEMQLEWLSSEDPDRVEVALAISEVELFQTEADARNQLRRISERWPHLRAACQRHLLMRKGAMGSDLSI